MKQFRFISSLVLFLSLSMQSVSALNIAVASNFKVSAEKIAEDFQQQFGIKVNISSASTATLYKQILQGAPFDLFLSADQAHVELLKDQHKAGKDQSFVYATGRLVFWKPDIQRAPTLQDVMTFDEKLAIANPKFAPYGIAAKQTLQAMKKWQAQTYVTGNNINQAFQFVDSKNVKAGLVSYASMIQKQRSHYVIIPQEWHQPIIQSGIVLTESDNREAMQFKQYLLSSDVQNYIRSQGYH